MSGFDRSRRSNFLKNHGWIEIDDNRYSPPDDLWKNKPSTFSLSDSEQIQLFLSDTPFDDEEIEK